MTKKKKGNFLAGQLYFFFGIALLIISAGYWYFTIYDAPFNDKGEIGDFIGGIANPIVGLLAAFLVWKSFHEQFKANKILREEQLSTARSQEVDFFESMVNDYIKSFEALSYVKTDIHGSENFTGAHAFYFIVRTAGNHTEAVQPQRNVYDVLWRMNYIVEPLSEKINQLENQEESFLSLKLKFYANRVYNYYLNYLKDSVMHLIELIEKNKHPWPDDLNLTHNIATKLVMNFKSLRENLKIRE